MILLRRAEHHCSIGLSGWQYLSSFNGGMCTFHYAAVAKVEVLINFLENQMLLLDNMPVTALPDHYAIREWAVLANLQQIKFEIRVDIQETKPLQVKSLWKARHDSWRVTGYTGRQEGDLRAEGMICTSRSHDKLFVTNKGGSLASRQQGPEMMEMQNRSLICSWFLAKQAAVRPKCWCLNSTTPLCRGRGITCSL